MMRPPRYPWLFLRVLAAWLSVPLMIRLLPFRSVLGFYTPRSKGPRDEARLARIGPYLEAAARLLPLGAGLCLRRCLVLFYFLNRYGEPVALRLGVAKANPGELQAHSWLTRTDGTVWGDDPGTRRYREIAVITGWLSKDQAVLDLARID